MNSFVDSKTNENIFEILKNKLITIQGPINKLRETFSGDDSLYKIYKGKMKSDFEIDWLIEGIWFHEGLNQVKKIKPDFKKYLYNNGKRTSNYIYEVIPSENFNMFDYGSYTNQDEITLNYEQVLTVFDGVKDEENFGVIWRLKDGFILKLLYICNQYEINEEDGTTKFYFDKVENKTLEFTL